MKGEIVSTTEANAKDRWPVIRSIAHGEVRRPGETLDELGELHSTGLIDDEQLFEILCARWDAGKTAIRRARKAQHDRRYQRNRVVTEKRGQDEDRCR